MNSMRPSTLIAALASAAGVAAHGHVNNIVINGVSYQGYDPTSFPYMADPPTVVGWATTQTDNGFVASDDFTSADIICHRNGTNAAGHAQVAAGDSISIQWTVWPESHKGPMIDYLAACDGSCETVDKTALEFFKIDGVGILDSTSAPGTWASDVLIENNNTWLVQIPATLKAGNYVLRHETIALHSAESAGGAQAYPQCFNLEVTGDGTDVPTGTLGTALYTETDPGIEINIYTTGITYDIPGPTLIAGVSASVSQVSSEVTTSASATAGDGTAAATTTAASAATTTAAAATTSTAAAETSSTVVAETSSASTSVAVETSAVETSSAATSATVPATTLATVTKATTTEVAATTSATASPSQTGSSGVAALYGQCGGKNWTGATSCSEGTCTNMNPYYFQCVNA
ncbi:Uu.00g006100.m01.CDS01 [Anthostomella pinea]|uniref:lytic cellulose monooxygenase (C4-dehydrogenating) n=1 Tax=Anthostomella pinea TaxID=933095 RepID=A0AAI8YIY7_9PEZI|nr:Uu.00g006100.m01.CDS01 [Anthostomella pinea]